MKKLILEAGFPQILADYPLISENNVKHALSAFLGPVNNCIVSGCGVSIAAGNWTIAAGWVVFENELMRVEEHTINAVGGGDIVIAQKYEVLIQNNPKPYLDGSTRPLIREVMCRFVKRTAENPYVQFLVDMIPYSTKLAGIVLPETNTWHPLASGKFTLAAGVALEATNPLQISKSRDGQLRFKGALNFDMLAVYVTASWRNILTINDVAMRPAHEVNFLIGNDILASSPGDGVGYLFQLLPTGVLRIRHNSVTYGIGPVNFSSVNLNVF
jgi:hypothetical protein